MPDTHSPPSNPPGFRFSRFDAVFMTVASVASVTTWNWPGNAGQLIAIVAGHFVLFCNVLRLRQTFELIWATWFVVVAIGCAAAVGHATWGLSLALVAPVTLVLVVAEVRSGRYRGLGGSLLRQ